ncbi:MAG: PH domain-containing protein [Nocardioidaceae bacterium]
MSESVALPRTYRPLGTRMVSGVATIALVGVLGFLWFMLPAHVRSDFGWFQRVTLIAVFACMVGLLNALFRTRARADEQGLTIINGYRTHRYEWAEIVSISLSANRPWALIDLADGTTAVVMALQTSDGERASRSARELADVIAGHSPTDRGE